MKLITNSAEIKVTENEDGSKSFQGVGSEVGVENRNGIILTPNCIEFARERYPLLYCTCRWTSLHGSLQPQDRRRPHW